MAKPRDVNLSQADIDKSGVDKYYCPQCRDRTCIAEIMEVQGLELVFYRCVNCNIVKLWANEFGLE